MDKGKLIPKLHEHEGVVPIEAATASEDNRNLDNESTSSAQLLKQSDIEKLKAAGGNSETIVGAVVANSATFAKKTVYSQEKYIKAKSKKYSSTVLIERPTLRGLADLYYSKNAGKICNLRSDALAALLHRANIRAGAKVLVVDTCQGLLASAVLERLGGSGKLVALHQGDTCQMPIVEQFNFSPEVAAALVPFPLYGIAGILQQTEPRVSGEKSEADEAASAVATTLAGIGTAADAVSKQPGNSAVTTEFTEQRRLRRAEKLARMTETIALLRSADLDALVIACKFHPLSLLKALLPLLGNSRPFAVFSESKEPLTECAIYLRGRGLVNLQLTERWTQEHQVLDQRTHPHMMMNAAPGYYLTGTTVAKNSGSSGLKRHVHQATSEQGSGQKRSRPVKNPSD